MNFWKAFFSSCLGAFVALIFFTILGIFILTIVGSKGPVDVKPNSVLSFDLSSSISELELEDPLANFFPGAGNQAIGLIQIKEAIAHAKTDPNIKGIYLNSGSVGAGITSTDEIRTSLMDFRGSGKWVIAYANNFSEVGYYLASVCDSVFLNPAGMIELNGLASEVMFYKKLFDKLEIRPQVFKVGDFKSAVEPFLRADLSDENKLQLNSILNSIYGNMLGQIASGRKIEAEKIKEIATKMLVRNAKQAKEFFLIDGLLYDDEMTNRLRDMLGLVLEEKVNLVEYQDYKHNYAEDTDSENEIAVIVADGEIVLGKSSHGIVGSITVVEELRKARERKEVKAVVLRINSPGGSAQASDEMWREVVLMTKEKTIIASLSDYAASGGYYLAMACDTIVAKPTTVTGSIGVFSVLFDMSQFFENKLGITSEEVKTGQIGELITMTRGLNETEKAIWQNQTNEIYDAFISKAAQGRNMTIDDLKKIASGRVWTGEQAKEIGLVDVLGDYDEAIKLAAIRAGITGDYGLRYYTKPRGLLDSYLGPNEESSLVEKKMLESLGGEQAILFQQWKKLHQMQGNQARMPFEFKIY